MKKDREHLLRLLNIGIKLKEKGFSTLTSLYAIRVGFDNKSVAEMLYLWDREKNPLEKDLILAEIKEVFT
jgi:hypothetical protein